jgi:hypothetical protein
LGNPKSGTPSFTAYLHNQREENPMHHPHITRVNPNQLEIQHPSRTPISLFANQHVPLERSAFQELSYLLELTETLERHYCADPDGFEQKPQLERVAELKPILTVKG